MLYCVSWEIVTDISRALHFSRADELIELDLNFLFANPW